VLRRAEVPNCGGGDGYGERALARVAAAEAEVAESAQAGGGGGQCDSDRPCDPVATSAYRVQTGHRVEVERNGTYDIPHAELGDRPRQLDFY
jgi:hypothetical protein